MAVAAYVAMPNGKGEQLVWTIRESITEILSDTNQKCNQTFPKALYGYRPRELNCRYEPFELRYGTRHRMQPSHCVSFLPVLSVKNYGHENLACSVSRVYGMNKEASRKKYLWLFHFFNVGDEVFSTRRNASTRTSSGHPTSLHHMAHAPLYRPDTPVTF